MPSLTTDLITDIAESPLADSARNLLSQGKLWKFVDTGDGACSALVLDKAPEPFRVEWEPESWSCECGSATPCLHLAALLLKAAESCREEDRLRPLRRESSPAAAPREIPGELFGWDESIKGENRETTTAARPRERKHRIRQACNESRQGTAGSTIGEPAPPDPKSAGKLDPEADLLFFTEPSHLEKRAVTLLGGADKVKAALKPKGLAAVVPRPGAGSLPAEMGGTRATDGSSRGGKGRSPAGEGQPRTEARFRDLRGGEWAIRPALVTIRKDDSIGPPRPWSDDGLPEPEFPGSDEIRDTLAEYIGAGDAFITTAGRSWTYRPARRLRIRFDALLSAAGDDPLYEPIAELVCAPGKDFPADEKPETAVTGAVIVSGDGLLVLDEENAVAAHLEDLGGSMWFLRLMLSRRVLTASDLRARLTGRRQPPANIEVKVPDLPDSLEVLKPMLVLEIAGHEGGTDLVPRWRYRQTIIDGRGRSEVVMDHSGTCPRAIGLRDRKEEDRVLDEAEEILGAALAWRRGRYARLSGDPNVPLRLDAPLQEVLAEFGRPLMDAGVELRLEDRPVRPGGGLSIRAGKKGSDLEMNASVTPGETGNPDMDEAAALELDSWLERGGLVRTRNAYFTLTGRALDQLNFLRDHGMEDSGFLTTNPDNLSLIDTVYAEIEADEETSGELERRRKAYSRLTSEVSDEETDFPAPPEEFRADLRPYQTQGYRWLLRLRQERLGGCLADDMGLGKTVQTLAYLSRLAADGRLGPSLLVGPVVTLGNWEAEIRRFAPELSFHRYAGPADRRRLPAADAGINLVVVSYQTLRNDIEKFLDRDWDHAILDEAHYVKNASSRTFKAIRSLTAAHRISLTGTPMENHLDDLWSQMSFLNPGLLGSHARFTERFGQPAGDNEAAGEKTAASRLGEILAPFILRRRKSEVLTELPPKDESIIRCEMTDEQAAAYESMRGLYRRQVTGLISGEGLNRSRVEIFTIISKLRLLAIHPPLAGEPFAGIEGGKMAVMDRLLEEIMEEDHKTLVFSQFLGALDRAEATCNGRGWDFSRLTGSTKDREEPIRLFNEDKERRIFLLSLKAGGVGINLTAADYVMLLDPWWNPAVEAQAVDRAHRMGQTRPVMVYRLITSGTIEERVLDLQQHKKDLIAGVLGENDAPSLSEGEILDLFE